MESIYGSNWRMLLVSPPPQSRLRTPNCTVQNNCELSLYHLQEVIYLRSAKIMMKIFSLWISRYLFHTEDCGVSLFCSCRERWEKTIRKKSSKSESSNRSH